MDMKTAPAVHVTLDDRDYVMLTRASYDALVDSANTVLEGETYPHEVAKAIAEGEHPVRALRKHRGMTATELAKAADIAQPYLSEIETEKKVGSAASLKAIAKALRVPLDLLVD